MPFIGPEDGGLELNPAASAFPLFDESFVRYFPAPPAILAFSLTCSMKASA